MKLSTAASKSSCLNKFVEERTVRQTGRSIPSILLVYRSYAGTTLAEGTTLGLFPR